MTVMDEARTQERRGLMPQQRGGEKRINVGMNERVASVAGGAIVALLGLRRMSLPGILGAVAGAAFIRRGFTGYCAAYEILGIDTAHPEQSEHEQAEELAERGIHVEQAFLINRPAAELYGYWRNFENLPNIMSHLKSVQVLDEKRSHWIAQAPKLAGGSVEWDAEITADEPNSRIAWRSLPGSDVESMGEIRFARAMSDRGTEVHVSMEYRPPMGKVGHLLATMFASAPRRQMREDLRRFKRLMETGEIPTIEGQPRGTCMGGGMYEGQ
jgi:uncharacterized membrane protein